MEGGERRKEGRVFWTFKLGVFYCLICYKDILLCQFKNKPSLNTVIGMYFSSFFKTKAY